MYVWGGRSEGRGDHEPLLRTSPHGTESNGRSIHPQVGPASNGSGDALVEYRHLLLTEPVAV